MRNILAASLVGVLLLPFAGRGQGGDAPIRQDRRYLSVKNDTKEKLVVFVQYNTFVLSEQNWRWFPGDPESGKAVAYAIAPGRKVALMHEDWPVNARCVRIWARSESGDEFDEYRDQDLWLVEQSANGQRFYMAPSGEVFTFTFGG